MLRICPALLQVTSISIICRCAILLKTSLWDKYKRIVIQRQLLFQVLHLGFVVVELLDADQHPDVDRFQRHDVGQQGNV